VRARAPLAFLFAIRVFAPGARAETQVKATDCSAALSGVTAFSNITINCIYSELDRRGVVKQAEDVGIEKSVILSLAARLKPGEKLDLAQAVVEVSHAVDVAVNLVKNQTILPNYEKAAVFALVRFWAATGPKCFT
jgi:hypothetical protein